MTSQPETNDKALRRHNVAEYPILAVLSLAPVHGYDLWRYLRDHLGTVWQLSRSQVYGLLAQLEAERLVRHERVEQANLPARKKYFLSADGQRLIDTWIREPVRHVRDFRLEFPVKYHFARARSSRDAQELLRNQMEVCRSKRADIARAMACSSSDIERNVLAYRIGVVDATVKWLEDLSHHSGDTEDPSSVPHSGESAS